MKASYYHHVRHDVLAHIPEQAQHVLSIGCGEGRTEALLVARGVNVTAIELNPEAAKAASLAGIHVICGDAGDLSVNDVTFDCLMYADVLEHLPAPESMLQEHVELLQPGGTVVVSVPNFRHYSVLWQLFVKGHIRYCDAGILDRTHLRLTTRRMIEEWFAQSQLAPTRIDYRINRFRDRMLSYLTFGLLREFLAMQVIVVGRRAPERVMASPQTVPDLDCVLQIR